MAPISHLKYLTEIDIQHGLGFVAMRRCWMRPECDTIIHVDLTQIQLTIAVSLAVFRAFTRQLQDANEHHS